MSALDASGGLRVKSEECEVFRAGLDCALGHLS